ncbi:DNA gyrase inhibitor YacG [Pseudooceanicola algae]|uniref:DNA gyrase inhibitor YacG n=1 Tax=Pseudooceanicola algae TaxID=1537215 RepID=A0A418SGY7_9RHOB|nr:DNA gyrase inhibitor YacG [Pseudooceanicola algae]QPM90311.1 DNA gyrase inhibitor YacG [Pseudooceanicola algae]
MTCPICKSASDAAYRPFCSARCADRDLARWMNGSYAVPSRDPEDIEAAMDAVEAEVEKALQSGRFS